MRTPVLQATVARRLLIVYRLDPEAAMYLVPAPFSVQLVNGHAVGTVSLDRIAGLRPRGFPPAMGYASENAAHRIAVEWDQGGRTATGTFVLARHTESAMTRRCGDRFFPGARERADFDVADVPPNLRISCMSRDDERILDVAVVVTEGDCGSALFGSTEEAWRFFRRGAVSYSLRRHGGVLDGVDIRTKTASARPAVIEHAVSAVFTPDLGAPDFALVLREVEAEWHAVAPPR